MNFDKSKALFTILLALVAFGAAVHASYNWGLRGSFAHGQLITTNVMVTYTPKGGEPVAIGIQNTIPQYGGGNYTQVKLFAPGNYPKYGTAAQDEMQYIALSTNATTPTQSDITYATNLSPACDDSSTSRTTSEVTGNGLTRAAGALTLAPSPFGPTPMAITVINTFTASGTQNGIDRSCLYNTLTVGAPQECFAVAEFTSAVNMLSGDTLKITWTINITYT